MPSMCFKVDPQPFMFGRASYGAPIQLVSQKKPPALQFALIVLTNKTLAQKS